MNTLRSLVFANLVLLVFAPKILVATTLNWKGSGSSSGWVTAANWNPAQSPSDGDTLVFSSTAVNTSPVANIGDANLAGVNFSVSGYQIVGAMANSEFCAKSVYASQPSSGVGVNCRFRTLFGNATLTCVNSGASLAFNGDFALDSGATVTVAGKGETTINNLTTLGSASTAISKTDTGVLTLTGSNTAYNTTITASAGTLQIAQSSVQGSTTTVVGVAATLSGGGICGTVINHGTIAPSTSAAAIFTLTINGSLTCPLDTSNPSYVTKVF